MATQTSVNVSTDGQFSLLRQRRFAPLFWTQFLGAANDSLFKFAFTMMVIYQVQVDWLPPAMAGLAIGVLFILPYLLFSATSGQITDKFEKSRIVRWVKNLELAIMAGAAWGFLGPNIPLLLACTFLMGLHSTVFGPVKFAYLPQVLGERELTGGNGLVEMGTFVASLLGNIVGGLLIAMPGTGTASVAIACLAVALAGRVAAQFVPDAPAADSALRINWNPASETWRNLKMAHRDQVVFRSLLGISWMWFIGAVFLSQFPALARDVLHGDEHVASFLLVAFSIGIGAGSLLCETLSRRHVEIGLVPLGVIGMSIFGIDLYFASHDLPASGTMGLGEFLSHSRHWRVIADLTLLSLFAGVYSVPMYALIQVRALPTHRARIIAANNILNALFIIASSVLVGALLNAGMTIPQVILVVALGNVLVAGYIFLLTPEYLLRLVAWVLARIVYRFRLAGEENIPVEGAAILVCNHVSHVDAVLLMAASPRPIYFVMDQRMFRISVLGTLFRLARAIPIAPRAEDPAAYESAIGRAAQVLADGDMLAMFPEGTITHDGHVQPFRGGLMKIIEAARRNGVAPPVVPMALTRMWGSVFGPGSLAPGGTLAAGAAVRRRLSNRVGLNIGKALPASLVQLPALRERVGLLLEMPDQAES